MRGCLLAPLTGVNPLMSTSQPHRGQVDCVFVPLSHIFARVLTGRPQVLKRHAEHSGSCQLFSSLCWLSSHQTLVEPTEQLLAEPKADGLNFVFWERHLISNFQGGPMGCVLPCEEALRTLVSAELCYMSIAHLLPSRLPTQSLPALFPTDHCMQPSCQQVMSQVKSQSWHPSHRS